MANRQITLEVCVASVDGAMEAAAGGADRLELNMALELGGVTPTVGLFQAVRQSVDLPVLVMIRPRAAGFCYSHVEQQIMLRDAQQLLEQGADGLVSGALLEDRTIDRRFWSEMRRLSRDRPLVFHRAFDVLEHQETAIQDLIDLGTTRVLTSGGCQTAVAGASQILRLRKLADSQLEVLPGSGVTPDNVVALLEATGCTQVHGSFRKTLRDTAGSVTEGAYPETCGRLVAAARAAIDAA